MGGVIDKPDLYIDIVMIGIETLIGSASWGVDVHSLRLVSSTCVCAVTRALIDQLSAFPPEYAFFFSFLLQGSI